MNKNIAGYTDLVITERYGNLSKQQKEKIALKLIGILVSVYLDIEPIPQLHQKGGKRVKKQSQHRIDGILEMLARNKPTVN